MIYLIVFIILVVMVVFIRDIIVKIRKDEDEEWVTLSTTTEKNRSSINEKYLFLKSKNILCRLISIDGRGIDQTILGNIIGARDLQKVNLEVNANDLARAKQYLTEFEETK